MSASSAPSAPAPSVSAGSSTRVPGPFSRVRTGIARRLARLGLAGLAVPPTVLILACWAATAVLGVLVLIPGLIENSFALPALGAGAPLWFPILLLVCGALATAARLVVSLLRDDPERPRHGRRLVRTVLVALGGVVIATLVLAELEPGLAALALVGTVATVVLLHVPLPQTARLAAVAAASTVPWIAAILSQIDNPVVGFLAWIWLLVLSLAVGFAAFGALYGVARGAATRVDGVRVLFRDDLPRWVLAAVFAGAAIVLVLRTTVLRGLFGADDATLWSFRENASWVHAAIVAAAIVVVVVRSTGHPLRRVGGRLVTASLATAASLQLLLFGVLIAVVLTVGLLSDGTGVVDVDTPLAVVPWVAVGIVVVVAFVVAHPWFARSAGRWMAWLGALYLIPGAVASAAGPASAAVPTFWASAPQVAMLIVLGSGVLLAIGVIRPAWSVPSGVIMRLLVIPVIAVHATALLPAPWESSLGRVVLVIGVVIAVLLFAPRTTGDPAHRAARLLSAALGGLLVLLAFVLALGRPQVLQSDTFTIVGTLWLAVPLAAVLSFTLVRRTEPSDAPAMLADPAEPD